MLPEVILPFGPHLSSTDTASNLRHRTYQIYFGIRTQPFPFHSLGLVRNDGVEVYRTPL